MQAGYRYRFYPTAEQEQFLRRTIGCARYVYNRVLEARQSAWHEQRLSIGYKQTSAMLTRWKCDPELAWLREISSVPLQQALRHLDSAFQRFFKQLARYPRFRTKRGRQCAEFTRSGFSIRDGRLYLAKMAAPLDVRWSRDLPSEPKTVTVSLEPDGAWYVSCRVVVEPVPLDPNCRHHAVGIDLGIEPFATLSTGEVINAPKPLKAALSKLARAQRRHARAQKGGKNREKRRRLVARLHARVRHVREDFLHKLSTRLIRENQTISVEDLNVRGMVKNRTLARSISDLGLSEFVCQLQYKAYWHGRALTKVDRWLASSQICSTCGDKTGPTGFSGLRVRAWTCASCGVSHDRDRNAALNINAAGLAVRACGGDVRRDDHQIIVQSPVKQETSLATVGSPAH